MTAEAPLLPGVPGAQPQLDLAAQGLQGFLAAQGLAAWQGFAAAQGLHGLTGFFTAAAQGLQGFLAAQGLQGLQAAICTAGPAARLAASGKATAPAETVETPRATRVLDRKR